MRFLLFTLLFSKWMLSASRSNCVFTNPRGRPCWLDRRWYATLFDSILIRLDTEKTFCAIMAKKESCLPTLRMESLALELWRSRVERSPKMRKEQQKRRIAGLLCGAVCVVCAAFALAYLLDSSHFTSREREPVVSDMMKYVLPWRASPWLRSSLPPILMVLGLALGYMICGWLCPMGLIQELVYKLPTPKNKKSPLTRVLSLSGRCWKNNGAL